MKDFIVGSIGVVLGIFIIILCRDLPVFIARGYPGPSFFPLILAAASFICGLYLIVKFFRNLKAWGRRPSLKLDVGLVREIFSNVPLRNAIKFTVIMVAYILLIPYVGFFLTSLIFMFTTQVIYGVSTLKALAISSAATFFIYILFIAILKVVVPEPILGALLYR